MADFAAVLKKTIDGLNDNNPDARAKVYDRARATIDAKLRALNPPPPQAVADRQREALENAIRDVEAAYAPTEADLFDPLSDDVFDQVFTSLEKDRHQPDQETSWPLSEPEIFADHQPVVPEVHEASLADRAYPAGETVHPDDSGPEGTADEELRPDPQYDRLSPLDPNLPQRPQNGNDDDPLITPARRRRPRRLARLLAAAVILIALAAGGVAAWLNRDALMAMIEREDSSSTTIPAEPVEAQPDTDVAAAPPEAESPDQPPAPAATPPARSTKFTQRLTEDGNEVDSGPAGGPDSIGEGTSVAAATQSGAPPSSEAAPTTAPPASAGGAEAAIPVGQQAIFYEERTTNAAGTADRGSTVWSVVEESPGDGQPPEPAIRAEVSVPSRDLQLRLTIRRNTDASLPASHIVEMIFLTPDDFAGGGIDNVLRITMKQTEEDPGNPLFGIPAKIADGFFLFALSDRNAEVEANTTLMRRQSWIDIPVAYKSGRRALVTIEKGIPGEEAFTRAFDAWQTGTSG